MRRTLADQWGNGAGVQQLLREAQEAGAEVSLESVLSDAGQNELLTTRIEQVGNGNLVIAPPMSGGSVRLLRRFDTYHISFRTARGRAYGQTKVLGKALLSTSRSGPRTGFRLAIPRELHLTDQQDELALLFGQDMVLEAELLVLGRTGPVLGLVTDLNPTGAHLRCRNALPDLHPGQKAQLRLTLPKPTGELSDWVTVAEAETDPETNAFEVRVSFERRNHAIEDAINTARERRSA